MRKLSWSLLLPFLLLFVQQAELHHEYSHYAKQTTGCDKAPASVDHCLECLGFAQIGGTATAERPQLLLLSGLSFGLEASAGLGGAEANPVSPRSRGPPAL